MKDGGLGGSPEETESLLWESEVTPEVDVIECGWDLVEWQRAGLSQRWVLNTDTVRRGQEKEGHQRDRERAIIWTVERRRWEGERRGGAVCPLEGWCTNYITTFTNSTKQNALMLNLQYYHFYPFYHPSSRGLEKQRCSQQLIHT